MSRNLFNLSGPLAAYVEKWGHQTDPVQLDFYHHCQENLVNPQLSIPLEQAPFMEMLVRLCGARRVLEIGTYAGFSAYALAKGLPKDGQVLCLEIDERFPKVGLPFWQRAGLEDKITLRYGDARTTIVQLVNECGENSFDFAFIDADKNAYEIYYEACLKLIRPGGMICIDNVLWQGKVADPHDQSPKTAAIRKLNEKLSSDHRVHMTMVPLWDGLTLLQVK